jgi:hemoglobin
LADEAVSHAFSRGFHPEHGQRLGHWAESLGQRVQTASATRPLWWMHSGNGPHQEMDRRAIACFDQALVDVSFARNGRRRHVLLDYFG